MTKVGWQKGRKMYMLDWPTKWQQQLQLYPWEEKALR